MKKIIFTPALTMIAVGVFAQSKFEVQDFGTFKLHAYISGDPLGDMNYIIEGRDALVILEPAVFFDNIREFGDYVGKLDKPVEKVIANYHAGGFNAYDLDSVVMIEGMPEFEQGEIYSGMMQGFAQAFGEAIDTRPHGTTSTIPVNSTQNWAGVSFRFSPGANSDFPAASILIGDRIYYTHFTPAIAHFSSLQITGREAIDAQLAELENARLSGADVFIGGHGNATATLREINFQISYLKKMKELAMVEKSADAFTQAILEAYPGISGEENVAAIATILYR